MSIVMPAITRSTARPRLTCRAEALRRMDMFLSPVLLALRYFAPDDRRDFAAQQFYRVHYLGVWHRADAHLRQKSLMAEEPMLEKDFLGHFIGIPHQECTARRTKRIELLSGGRRPAPLAADLRHHIGV